MNTLLNTTGYAWRFDNIVRGKNCTLFDAAGRRYLDLASGVWCTALGHSHPAVTRALTRQARTLLHSGFNFLHPAAVEAANAVLRITGLAGGRTIFLNSGSEAVALAVKIARHLAPGQEILSLADSYLGAQVALDTAASGWRRFDWLAGEDPEPLPFERIAPSSSNRGAPPDRSAFRRQGSSRRSAAGSGNKAGS